MRCIYVLLLLVGFVSGQVGGGNAQVYNFELGKFSCKIVSDGAAEFPLTAFYSTIPKATLDQNAQFFNFPGTVNANINPVVCQTGDWLVLLDAGTLKRFIPETSGLLIQNLKNAGIDPAEIREVIISHGHIDHFSGLFSNEGKVLFPNAKIWIPEADYEFYTNRTNMDFDYFEDFGFVFDGLEQAGANVRLYNAGPLFEGFEAIDASGHSPGHMIIKITSDGDTLYYLADTVFNQISIAQPQWLADADMDSQKGIDTRVRIVNMLADEGALVTAYHVGFPSLGFIKRDGTSFQWVPIQWEF